MSGPNKYSAEWMMLRRWNEEQIKAWQEELESLDATPDRTQQLRGMIYALREQISFVEPTPRPTMKDVTYGYEPQPE